MRAQTEAAQWIARLPDSLAEQARPLIARRGGISFLFALAESEACALGHERIGTEHLMLGILRFGYRPALVSNMLGLAFDSFRAGVLQVRGESSAHHDGPLPFASDAVQALATAIAMAPHLGHALDSYRLLIGIVEQSECAAVRVLDHLRVPSRVLRVLLDLELLPDWLTTVELGTTFPNTALASFRPSLQRILADAKAAALQAHSRVLDLALLLRCVLDADPTVGEILRHAGLDDQLVRAQLDARRRTVLAAYPPTGTPREHLRLTQQFREVREVLVYHARDRSYSSIGVEELLLAMVALQESHARTAQRATLQPSVPSPPSNVLAQLGVDPSVLRLELERRPLGLS